MATQAVDVACTLLNVIMSQVMAFRELDKDAKELHRHLSSMRHLIESLSLSPGRTLTSPEANSALVDFANSLCDFQVQVTKMQNMTKCTRFLRARDLLQGLRSAVQTLDNKLKLLQTTVILQSASSQEHLLRQFEASREGLRLMRLELLQSYYTGAEQLQSRMESLLMGPGGAAERMEEAVRRAEQDALQRHGVGLDEADKKGREVALQELRDEVPDELRAAKEAQEVQYLARTDHEGAWQDRHGAQLFVGVQQ